MAVENWKLWIIPFAIWALFLSWHSGYQSGYQEGHATAWEMSRPSVLLTTNERIASNEHDFSSADHNLTSE
jgi:hypothetical protein